MWLIPANDLDVLPDGPVAVPGDGRAPTIEDLRERVTILEAILAEIITRVVPYWVEALGKAAETLATPELIPHRLEALSLGSEPASTQGEN